MLTAGWERERFLAALEKLPVSLMLSNVRSLESIILFPLENFHKFSLWRYYRRKEGRRKTGTNKNVLARNQDAKEDTEQN